MSIELLEPEKKQKKTDIKFKLNDTGEKVAVSRYYQKNEKGEIIEDWDGLVLRVVNHVCKNETQNFKDKMIQLIGKTEFLPNSPCLVNAGRKTKKAGLMACYVSKAPEDNWVSMCDTIKNFGDVARAGGGCGLFLGNIRPEGSPVFGSTHAKACGPIEHMRMISEVMSSITQAGFRGMANLASLNVSHPDIINFIKCKQKERALKTYLREDIFKHYPQIINNIEPQLKIVLDKFLYNFNISVLVSDKFMEAEEKNEDWDLVFEDKVYQTIKAREIFNLITENAWRNGDPGCLFEDTINNKSPYRFSGQKINASNPCVAKGTLVNTPYGYKTVENVKVGDLVCSLHPNGYEPVTSIEKHDNMPVFKVKFSDGGEQVVTAAHCYHSFKGGNDVNKYSRKLRLDELEVGDYVQVHPTKLIDQELNENEFNNGLMFGILLGDGSLREPTINISSSTDDTIYNENVKNVFTKCGYSFTKDYKSIDGSKSMSLNLTAESSRKLLKTFNIPSNVECHNKAIFSWLKDSEITDSFLRGLINGLLATDGNVNLKSNHPQIRFDTCSFELAQDIRRALLLLGIHARITVSFNDDGGAIKGRKIIRKYPKHTINVSGHDLRTLGIICSENINTKKAEKIQKILHISLLSGGNRKASIVSIEPCGSSEVYDLYCEASDSWITDGYVQWGCGEQVLPSSNSNCNLGSIDVSKFYSEKKEDVDWNRLEEAIKLAFQFLDDVIDAHDFPSETFKEWGMDNRPVGLGVMGFADLLLKLKIKYGSKESIKFAEKLMKFFSETAHNKSVQLGKERGTPRCCQYKELDHRRNVTTTSIAPTGTIALLAGCSSSIEPIFSPTIFRHDNTGSYEIKHPDSESEWFACALDGDGGPREVTYQEHIQIQSAFQKYCDSAISKTINLPSTATVDDIKNAYKMAWELGCKGITVYRNNSKTTQVLNLSNKIRSQESNIERPLELPCDIYKLKADGIDWHIIVGIKDGSPYELFAVNGGKELPKNGFVVKRKKKHYSLLDENKEVLLDNIIEFENKIDPKIGLETRRFSLELRHGIPPKYIVEQIDKSNEVITSFSKAAARIFKKYYLESDTVSGSLCPECLKEGKESKLVFTSGCQSCPTCNNYSKCG